MRRGERREKEEDDFLLLFKLIYICCFFVVVVLMGWWMKSASQQKRYRLTIVIWLMNCRIRSSIILHGFKTIHGSNSIYAQYPQALTFNFSIPSQHESKSHYPPCLGRLSVSVMRCRVWGANSCENPGREFQYGVLQDPVATNVKPFCKAFSERWCGRTAIPQGLYFGVHARGLRGDKCTVRGVHARP